MIEGPVIQASPGSNLAVTVTGVGTAASPLLISARPRIYATGSRPSAVTSGDGAMIYDTTLNKPIWSDGAVWRDAAGTAV